MFKSHEELNRRSSTSSIQSRLSYSDTNRTWSVLDARVCLPAVLNDPRHPIRNYDPKLVAPPTSLRDVRRGDFSTYLAKLKKRTQSDQEAATEAENQWQINGHSNRIPNRFHHKDFDMKNEISLSLSGTGPDIITNLSNHDLQLKQWLDQTEVELGRRLSSRATSFLAAVSAQDQLKNILKEARETAQSLRSRVHQVGEAGTKSNFSAINCSRKSKRLKAVLERVKDIQTVQQSPATIRLLLSTYDFAAATELIDTIREVLSTELHGISALRLLHTELDNLEKQLNMMLVDEASSMFDTLLKNGDMDDERAESVQSAIVRAARTADTIQAVHDVVECRANVLLDLSREEDNIINKINQNIHHMKELLDLVCRGVKVDEFVILKKTSVEVIQHRLLRSLQDFNFVKCKEFPLFLPILYSFIDHCNHRTGVKGPLSQHLKAETNRYLNKFHEERRQRLTLLLDSEEWRAAEVPRELQEAVDAVLAQGQGQNNQKSEKPKRAAISMAVDVSGEKFAVIGCSLLLIRMIQEYLSCLARLPEPSLLHKLADLLSLFNSRCCQLVLGGGATTTLGLRSITIKHLALTARSLQLVLRVLPSVRGASSAVLSGTNAAPVALRQLNKVEADVQTHIQEVWGKICSIMEEFFTKHVTKYEVKAPIPSQTMRVVVKQVKRLSDSLHEVLPAGELVALLTRVHSIFTFQMDRRIVETETQPNDGLLLSDVAYYMSNLRKLPGMAGIDWDHATGYARAT